MLGDNAPVLADYDAIRIGMNLDRTPDRTGYHRVLVVVEAHQAGLRDRCRHRVESIEPAGIGNELRSLRLEHLPDRLLGQLRMAMRLGVGDAFIEQPSVHLVVGLEPQPWREEALTDEPDLVLDLTLLPARCRRAGDRIDKVMTAHLQEAAIVEAILADEDRLHCGLHVVVDAASAGSLEQGEGAVVRIEHHLLRLARIGAHEQHATVAEPDVGNFYDHRRAAQQDDFVAPVELVGFAGSEAQWDVGCCRRLPVLLGPSSGIAAHGIVAAVIAAPAQFLENPDQRQLLAGSLGRVPCQQFVEIRRPPPQLRPGLDRALVLECGLARAKHLADRIPGHLQVPRDLPDRLALDEMLAPNPANRLHRQHASPARFESEASSATGQTSGGQFWTPIPRPRGALPHEECYWRTSRR